MGSTSHNHQSINSVGTGQFHNSGRHPSEMNVYSKDDYSGRNIFVDYRIGDVPYRGLMDTGSQINLC